MIQVDNVEKPSWQAQIVGSKTWTLIPMPECESQCPGRMEITMKRGDIRKCVGLYAASERDRVMLTYCLM